MHLDCALSPPSQTTAATLSLRLRLTRTCLSFPWVHHSMAWSHCSPRRCRHLSPNFPTLPAGLPITPKRRSTYRKPGTRSGSHPLASTKATAARGGHPISPTQHRSAEIPRCKVARQLWDFSGFLICYQFGGCHAVFGFLSFLHVLTQWKGDTKRGSGSSRQELAEGWVFASAVCCQK